MRQLFAIALLTSAVGWAAGSSDDDEDEAPTKPSPVPTAPTPATPAAKPAEKPSDKPLATPAAPGAAAPTAIANPDAQRLVNGAPLYDPNVAVHIVEKKQFSDSGRFEVVLFPAAPQINGKFTEHFGTAAQFVYHLHENFAFQVFGQYNWFSSESDFNQELINKVREQAQAATSLLLVGGATAGVEVAPLYGKFAYYEGRLGHFSIVLNAGAGAAETRLQLRAANDAGPATFGDAGMKFMGSVGGGFRVLLGDRFALRLEVRDLVYTARVDSVNGCGAGDLAQLDAWFHNHQPNQDITTVPVAAGCNVQPFNGKVSSSSWTYDYSSDIPLAFNLVQNPSSDVLNNVSFYAGLSFLF